MASNEEKLLMKTRIDGMWIVPMVWLMAMWAAIFSAHAAAEEPSRTVSRSPDGVYAIVFRMLPEKLRTNGEEGVSPPQDASLYLVRRDPYRMITEISPTFRSRWQEGTSDYACHWNPSGSKVAVAFQHRRSGELVVYEHRSESGWRRARLPELDGSAAVTRLVKKHTAGYQTTSMSSSIHAVRFRQNGILVTLEGSTRSHPPLSITLIYRLTPGAGGWKASIISEEANPIP